MTRLALACTAMLAVIPLGCGSSKPVPRPAGGPSASVTAAATANDEPERPGSMPGDGGRTDPMPVALSTVTVGDAERLAGRQILVAFDLLANDDHRAGFAVYSNGGPASDGDEVERSVWVPRGGRVPERGTAVGTLRVLRHGPAVGADGTRFPAYVELRAVLDLGSCEGQAVVASGPPGAVGK